MIEIQREITTPEQDKTPEEAEPKPSEVIKKPKDRLLSFWLAQIFFCGISVIFVLVITAVGGEFYSYSRAVFDECFNKPININQVLDSKQTKAILQAQSLVENKTVKSKALDNPIKSVVNSTDISNSMCMPVNGSVTSEYSYRIHPISGDCKFHSGIDIGANNGDDIYCVLDGVVSEVDTKCKTTYGKYIVVKHSSGASTLYGHCSKIIAKPGQSVKKGQVIARVGSTGNSTGPHLHFEVKVNGEKLNPRWFADFV